jgi:hypothetical protein
MATGELFGDRASDNTGLPANAAILQGEIPLPAIVIEAPGNRARDGR